MVDLVKAGSRERSCSDETMGLGRKNLTSIVQATRTAVAATFVGCPYSQSRPDGILFQETRL